jgi:hypothetical protein
MLRPVVVVNFDGMGDVQAQFAELHPQDLAGDRQWCIIICRARMSATTKPDRRKIDSETGLPLLDP